MEGRRVGRHADGPLYRQRTAQRQATDDGLQSLWRNTEPKTILTPQELCQTLTDLRDNYDKRVKGIETKKQYEGRLDELPKDI